MRELLESIAQKEQEIRGRLLRARAHAEAIVATARGEAEQIHSAGQIAAAAEARVWLDEQEALARREATTSLALSIARIDDQGEGPAFDAAVQLILVSILLRPAPLPGG